MPLASGKVSTDLLRSEMSAQIFNNEDDPTEFRHTRSNAKQTQRILDACYKKADLNKIV